MGARCTYQQNIDRIILLLMLVSYLVASEEIFRHAEQLVATMSHPPGDPETLQGTLHKVARVGVAGGVGTLNKNLELLNMVALNPRY